MAPYRMSQALELARHTNERAVRLALGARVADPQLGTAQHDVLDRPGAGEQRHLTGNGIDPRCLHAQRPADRANRLPLSPC